MSAPRFRNADDGALRRRSWRCVSVLVLVAMLATLPGCGAAAKRNVAIGLMGTGVVASTVTGVLALGCTTPNPDNPQIQSRGPCMPPATYEEAKPFIWTTFVLGIIMAATGVAIIATINEKPSSPDPSPPPDPMDEPSCKGSKYCY
ncbi:MAG TPA: hypothetical protein PK156_14780 [Polyangium sp.]|nr:hypothetical protein [Polyangium sp.]